MSPEELKKLIEDLKKDGKSDEDLAKLFLRLYLNKKVDIEDLKTLLAAVGFDLNEDIEKVLRENPESVGLGEEKKEESKPEDKKEDDKSEKPEEKSEDKKEEKSEEKSEEKKDDKEDEESEWNEAKKYFHFNK